VSDGVPEGYVLSRNPQEAVELFLEAAPEIFRRELAVAETEVGRKVTCMLTDAFIWFAGDMAAEMKVSWVAFWTSGTRSLLISTQISSEKQSLSKVYIYSNLVTLSLDMLLKESS